MEDYDAQAIAEIEEAERQHRERTKQLAEDAKSKSAAAAAPLIGKDGKPIPAAAGSGGAADSKDSKRPAAVVEAPEVRDPETGFLVDRVAEDEESGLIIAGTGTTDGKDERKANAMAAMGLVDDTGSALINKSKSTALANQMFSFEINYEKMEDVRKTCQHLGYPTLEEYDFRKDTGTAPLPISLKPSTQIRSYQEKSLSKMFGNGRARSGIIVLPCGAGKTLVGITAAQTVKKSTLVFCTTGVAVDQWRRQFLLWTNLPAKYICTFTSQNKDEFRTEAVVVITTYNMVSFHGKRSAAAEKVMKVITTKEWGMVVLDEVHVTPARIFRECMTKTHSRCKLGLTATLVREDNLIDDLYFLIGPKLYEANWLDLQNAGHIATVKCIEVWCPMTAEFYKAYLNSDSRMQRSLYVMNPNKFRTCEFLIRWHEKRGYES